MPRATSRALEDEGESVVVYTSSTFSFWFSSAHISTESRRKHPKRAEDGTVKKKKATLSAMLRTTGQVVPRRLEKKGEEFFRRCLREEDLLRARGRWYNKERKKQLSARCHEYKSCARGREESSEVYHLRFLSILWCTHLELSRISQKS